MASRNPQQDAGNQVKRRLNCPFYVKCLDQADSREWPSWTCEHCRVPGGKETVIAAPGYVYCKNYRATLSVAACVRRREQAQAAEAPEDSPYARCLTCDEGGEIAGMEKPVRDDPDGGETAAAEPERETSEPAQTAAQPPETAGMETPEEPKPLCEECKKNVADSIGGRLCRSCAGRRGARAANAKRAAKKAAERQSEPNKGNEPGKEEKSAPAQRKEPGQPSSKTLTVDFTGHDELLAGLEQLARSEFRPPALQILAMINDTLEKKEGRQAD